MNNEGSEVRNTTTRARSIRKKSLAECCLANGGNDPEKVDKNSSLALNLSAKYCNFGTPQGLKNYAMGALIQGLRIANKECGFHLDGEYI